MFYVHIFLLKNDKASSISVSDVDLKQVEAVA